MSQLPVPELRRLSATLDGVRGRAIVDASLTADRRQLRLTLDDGELLVVRMELDALGRPYLEVDAARRAPEARHDQLEVRFGT